MNQNAFKFIVSKLFGTLLRHGLSAVGAYLAAQGMGTLDEHSQSNILEVLIGAIAMLISFGWSFARSHLSELKSVQIEKLAQTFGTIQEVGGKTSIGRAGDGLPPPLAILFAAFLVGAFTSCAVVSKFDQNSYDSALALKSESIGFISHASVPCDPDALAALRVKLSAQLAYQQGKGKQNVISAKQWNILLSEEHDLLGKFLKDWESGKPMSDAYIMEKTQQVSDAFDQLIFLEGAKLK